MLLTTELLEQVREQYGDAFYLLDSKQFEQNFYELKRAFADIYPNFNIAYSYKTNYTPRLCQIVDSLGGYAEVVSEMELELAETIGVLPQNIIWNGPIKPKGYLETFLLKGGVVNIDSFEEFNDIKQIVLSNRDNRFNLGIRCNFDVNDGVLSRFGFDVYSEEFRTVLDFVTTTENVYFNNLQCHFAKRNLDYWVYRTKGMLKLLDTIEVLPKRIDLGGGLFGKIEPDLAKQFSHAIPSYSDYAEQVAQLFSDYFSDKSEKPELLIEPGSALVGDCMKFVGAVKTIKEVRGQHIATILGSQKNINMEGVNPPITIYPSSIERQYYNDLKMVGFTCIESDLLYRGYQGQLAVGDMVVFSNCGSYSLVMKPPFILPNFPVLDISHGTIELTKRAESFSDVFQTFIF